MKLLPPLSLLLSLAGWALMVLTTMNLLSGHFDDRTCQTDCVKSLFFAAVFFGGAALLTGLVSLVRRQGRMLGVGALVLALPLCAIIAVLFVTGNYGNMMH